MLEQPGGFNPTIRPEYDRLINAIWDKESEVRMVRTFMTNENTGTARAFVSRNPLKRLIT
jgi:hypothetical protein